MSVILKTAIPASLANVFRTSGWSVTIGIVWTLLHFSAMYGGIYVAKKPFQDLRRIFGKNIHWKSDYTEWVQFTTTKKMQNKLFVTSGCSLK